jgi:hypothetical protein
MAGWFSQACCAAKRENWFTLLADTGLSSRESAAAENGSRFWRARAEVGAVDSLSPARSPSRASRRCRSASAGSIHLRQRTMSPWRRTARAIESIQSPLPKTELTRGKAKSYLASPIAASVFCIDAVEQGRSNKPCVPKSFPTRLSPRIRCANRAPAGFSRG